jgi:hypothetical protein
MKTIELELDRLNVTVTGEDEYETRKFAQQLSQFYRFKDTISSMGLEGNYQILFDKIIASFVPDQNGKSHLSSQHDKVIKGIVYSALIFFVNKHNISFDGFSLDNLTFNGKLFKEWVFQWLEAGNLEKLPKLKYNGKKIHLSDPVDKAYFVSTISAGMDMMHQIFNYLAFASDLAGDPLYENYPVLEDGEEPDDDLFVDDGLSEDDSDLNVDIILMQKNGLYGVRGIVDGDILFEQCNKDIDNTLRHIMEEVSHFNIKLNVGDKLNTEELSSVGFDISHKKKIIRKPRIAENAPLNQDGAQTSVSRKQIKKNNTSLSSSNLSLSTEKEALSGIDLNDVDFGNQKPN